jgi:hypothetical protein
MRSLIPPPETRRPSKLRVGFAALPFAAGAVLLLGVARASPARASVAVNKAAADRAYAAADASLWIDMRNVDLHVDAEHVMHVRSLRGQVVSTTPGAIAWLDQPKSFEIRETSGTVALDGEGITALLNENAFNYPGAPIKHLKVTVENGQVVQAGTLHKGVDIPFRMWAVPVLQPDGKIRLHPSRLTILGVNGLALMHALHLHLSSMMDLSKAHGVSVSGDDLFLDPLAIIPPPVVTGKLAAVRIEGSYLVQDFARTADDSIFGTFVRPDSGSENYIYFRGGLLRFGKLTMTDTDLLIHDADERDPFDLYFPQYNRQLAAGHTKNLPDLGLRTWMVDYGKLTP